MCFLHFQSDGDLVGQNCAKAMAELFHRDIFILFDELPV